MKIGADKRKPAEHISLKYMADSLDEFEPGSNRKVLKNLLHISNVHEIEDLELVCYMRTESKLVKSYSSDHIFTFLDIQHIPKLFLGTLYSWAGSIRSVNISKGGFTFATALALPSVIQEFEQKILLKYTPCNGESLKEVAQSIAIVHAELLLIHPFREGNGRTARLLANLMARKQGIAALNFDKINFDELAPKKAFDILWELKELKNRDLES